MVASVSRIFLNQTIHIPVSYFESPMLGTNEPFHQHESSFFCSIDEQEQHFYSFWTYILFYLFFLSVSMFSYKMYLLLAQNISENKDILDEMRDMLNEISEMTVERRKELSERYYILTNVLVNRFRIDVYEKILK